MSFGLTTGPALAAAVAAGHPPLIPWRTSRAQLARIGADDLDELHGRPVFVHGSVGWGESERRAADRLGVDSSACGHIVARAVVSGFARRVGRRVDVSGSRPSWAPADQGALVDVWPQGAERVVLLDDMEPVEPVVAMGSLGGPWSMPSGLVARIVPAETSAPACPGCGAQMLWASVDGGPRSWSCGACRAAADAGPMPAGRGRPAGRPRSLEVAFAQAAAAAGVEGWVISDTLPPFGDEWITELRPVVPGRLARGERAPWPAPPITIDRRADVGAQAQQLVELIPRLQAWWSSTLVELAVERPAPGMVEGCAWCEMPTVLCPLNGDAVLLEGAGYVDAIAESFGFACSRSGPRGCTALVHTPVACSTDCEREALRRAGRDPSTAVSPPEADWRRALDERRLWRAAGDVHEAAVRRSLLIRLAEGAPLPAFNLEMS